MLYHEIAGWGDFNGLPFRGQMVLRVLAGVPGKGPIALREITVCPATLIVQLLVEKSPIHSLFPAADVARRATIPPSWLGMRHRPSRKPHATLLRLVYQTRSQRCLLGFGGSPQVQPGHLIHTINRIGMLCLSCGAIIALDAGKLIAVVD
jgi:hypothetical protein